MIPGRPSNNGLKEISLSKIEEWVAYASNVVRRIYLNVSLVSVKRLSGGFFEVVFNVGDDHTYVITFKYHKWTESLVAEEPYPLTRHIDDKLIEQAGDFLKPRVDNT
jgi:hypothetical protein